MLVSLRRYWMQLRTRCQSWHTGLTRRASRFSLSITNQIRFGIAVIVVAALLLTGSLLIYTSAEALLQTSRELQQERSHAIAATINAYIEDLQLKLSYLARVPGLTNLSRPDQTALLEGLVRHNAAYESVTIVGSDGTPTLSLSPFVPNSPPPTENLSNTLAFIRAYRQQEEYVAPVEIQDHPRLAIATLAVPIRNREDQVAGALIARVNLDFLYVVTAETQIGQTGYTYLIDSRNIVIADSRTPFSRFTPLKIDNPDLLQKLQRTDPNHLSLYPGLSGVMVLGGVSPVPSTQWRVVVELPLREAYKPLTLLVLRMAIATLALTILTVLAGMGLAQRITQPLKDLTAAAASLSQGHWNAPIPAPPGRPRNELDMLARAFQRMATQLQKSFADLEAINADLEHRVADRTAELTAALHGLRRTQAQLVQTEKMSSLGQMVAGIAHEINNPVNFIHGNLDYARTYLQELLALQQLYADTYPDPSPDIQAQLEDLDLEFVAEDLPRLLESMQAGTDRIQAIVLSLRSFARLDESERKPANLHEGLDSTLVLLQSRLKLAPDCTIEVVRQYGDLPIVDCYPGQLNQVFMNLVGNAIDALGSQQLERRQRATQPNPNQPTASAVPGTSSSLSLSPAPHLPGGDRPTITITTQHHAHQITIAIQDNGPGIPTEIQPKLFDPFFTTKPVGQGTGLGLSVSYQIVVDRHGGTLTCTSELGVGTTFTIQIPVRIPAPPRPSPGS
jgi:signal transduction histidine kinase